MLGVIGRLDPQKGFDLVAGAARRLVASGARLVVLGSGDASLLAGIRAEAARAPGRIAVLERFDRELSQADLRGRGPVPDAVPVRAMRAGPDDRDALRHAAGGAPHGRAGRHDRRPRRGSRGGTGFLFDDATPEALAAAVERALRVFGAADRAPWQRLVARGMAVDWAWETSSAPLYVALFRRAVALRQAARG